MTLKFYWICAITFFLTHTAFGQIDALNKIVDKINSYQNITYAQVSRQKSPFTNEWSTLNVKTSVERNKQGIELYDMTESRGFRYVHNGSTRMDLDLNSKTYELKDKNKEESYKTPFYWANFLKNAVVKSPGKIKTMPDTVINSVLCLHIKITKLDTASNGEIDDIYFNKKTNLPVFVRQFIKGQWGKGDAIGENITSMVNEDKYSNYQINLKSFPNISAFNIPSDFSPEKKVKMLSLGTQAPGWSLSSTLGKTISDKQLRGKVTLVDFSFNACAACMLSIPMLNKLHERYKNSDVEIFTINTYDSKQSVIAFSKKNKIKYPILLNGKNVSKSFQVSAYPSFYLIDKKGSIAFSIDGYSKELESELIKKIEELKKDI